MACSHPLGVTPIRNDDGETVGGYCELCKRYAFRGDSFWTDGGGRACRICRRETHRWYRERMAAS